MILFIAMIFSAFPERASGQVQRKAPSGPERRAASTLPLPAPLGSPPPGPVRCSAEWEESEGVITLWANNDLIDKLQQDTLVYIPVDDISQKNWWTGYLGSHGIPLDNIRFLFIETNTVWTRDYGPWFIWDGNNDMGIVDYIAHPQSTYGSDDNLFPYNFSQMFGINYYDTGIYHVGGNWFPAGSGRAFSTTRVYTQNPFVSKQDIDLIHKDYLGVDHYNTTHVAPWTIEHHDCWGKPCGPDTLIVVSYEEDSEYYAYAETMYELISTLESPWQRPYKILRLPMFKMGTGWNEYKPYMNSLVSNKSVYVPITGSPDDQVALGVFQDAFPGHKIVGVDHMGCGFNDALHCRTRNFVKRDAIRIYPMPPGDTESTSSGYTVTAEVVPPKGSALSTGYPKVHWTATGGPPYSEIVMTSAGGADYTAEIPAQPLDREVSICIEARDDGGRSAVYPLVAPQGMMSFRVRRDTEAPVISRFAPLRSAFAGAWPRGIRLLCKDDMTNPEVKVKYAVNGIPQSDITLVRESMCYWYSGLFGGSVSPGDVLTYRVVSTDNSSQPNIALHPLMGEICCPIADSGGVGVVELSTRPDSSPFIAKTLSELGIPYSLYSSWPADWNRHDAWFICLGVFVDRHALSNQEANDLVNALQGGASVYMESSDAWCFDPERSVYKSAFGVLEISDGGDIYGGVEGLSQSLADGLTLDYRGESAWMDEIGAVSPARLLFKTESDSKGRAVQYDAGAYKTIAGSFPLGGFRDSAWPDTKKEILIRILEYLGLDEIRLYATGEAKSGATVTIRLEGDYGDRYFMLASPAEDFSDQPGYGVLRLDMNNLHILDQGSIPPSGFVEVDLLIPSGDSYIGLEIHLQAVTGPQIKPFQASLTNRDILTITK